MITFTASTDERRPGARCDFPKLRRTTYVGRNTDLSNLEVVRDLPARWDKLEGTVQSPVLASFVVMHFVDAIADDRWRLPVVDALYSLVHRRIRKVQ